MVNTSPCTVVPGAGPMSMQPALITLASAATPVDTGTVGIILAGHLTGFESRRSVLATVINSRILM